jgi:hypothetical protein
VLAKSAPPAPSAVSCGRWKSIVTDGGCSILKPKPIRCDSRPLAAKAQGLSRLRIEVLVASCILALYGASALADDGSREQVRVIGSEQAKTSYWWRVPGRASSTCLGSGCSRFYTPAESDKSAGAVFRLLRSDSSIVVVQCRAPNTATQDATPSQIPRRCITPDASYQVAAEFHPGEVKLFMFAPSADGPGGMSSDTYSILGMLVPSSSPPSIAAEPAPAPTASVSASGNQVSSQVEAPVRQSTTQPVRQQNTVDSNSSPALLTYLTHELIDPTKPSAAHPGMTAAQEALQSLGPVRPATEPQVPASQPQQGPPQAVAAASGQAPLPQGPVNTALTPVPAPPPDRVTLTPFQVSPASPAISATQARLTTAPQPVPAGQDQIASAPPAGPKIYPAQRPAHQTASQFATGAAASPAAMVRIDPETGTVTPIIMARAATPNPDFSASPAASASDSPRLRRMDKRIAALDFPVQELAEQWAQFESECPEPTTNAMCLDAKGKVIQSMQKIFESKIVLVDQRISILETGPQDAFAQGEEADSKDIREKMKLALDRFPLVLAHLNKALQDLRHASDDQ